MLSRIKAFIKRVREDRFNRDMLKYFDWPLLINVLAISLFGVVCIFSATTRSVTEKPANIVEMLRTQSIAYPRLQLLWIGAGLVVMGVIVYFSYKLYERYANTIYALNIIMLVATLVLARAGRGGMTAFFTWGSGGDRGLQFSEFGKVAMIIAFSRAFSMRTRPAQRFSDLLFLIMYLGIPVVLVVVQPDFGTALVYVAVFAVMVFVSGTNWRIIAGVLFTMMALAIPLWYYINNTASGNFRFDRILMWLDPEAFPDKARQIINGQIAIGSGGLLGKGIVSPASFASLGYISDDHTDFIFAIVCESFGLVGGCALILAYMLLFARLIYLGMRTEDPFGSYAIMGVTGMLLFHVVENIGMVIGLLPVTGIPLPFVSYGGSNMLTNMASIGLVLNVVMRSRRHEQQKKESKNAPIQLENL